MFADDSVVQTRRGMDAADWGQIGQLILGEVERRSRAADGCAYGEALCEWLDAEPRSPVDEPETKPLGDEQ